MIQFVEISKELAGKHVLNHISGTIDSGKINLIIGGSGQGKSVLLKCLIGLMHINSGDVLYDNRSIVHADDFNKIEIRKKIGMLFQSSALFDSLNTQENIMFPLNMFTNMNQKEKLDRVNFCLDRVGLVNCNKKMPSDLSGGMKKRVGIARAIVNNPKYLFCDEPNSGLDPTTSIKIDELIRDITLEYKITTVVVSHDINSIMTIGDKIFFLFDGGIIWQGASHEILNTNNEQIKTFLFSNKLANLLYSRDKK